MIDLSPHPHDKGSDTAPPPRHDLVPGHAERREKKRDWGQFSHEHAEAAVQRLSRWAGPVALLAVLLLLGLWLIY
ncbi:hypothetical protein [Sphingobium sp.]|uniref:hypothetical protein n=1 Tax=Sphingobium sp. TaxID=1912891 RepID=UPI0035C66E94